MPSLVTLAEAKMQVQVDTDALDPWFETMIPAISGAVLSWLKDDWRAYETINDSNGEPLEDSSGDQFPILDSNGQPIVKPVVKAATLVELAVQFRFRDGDGTPAVPSHWGHGYVLSAGPTSLLTALRKSTVA
jgi:hypothetical protein